MNRSDYSFCDKRLVITIMTLVAVVLLGFALCVRCHESASQRLLKTAAYLLVVAISAGFWFDVWATQQCSESSRTRVEKLQH